MTILDGVKHLSTTLISHFCCILTSGLTQKITVFAKEHGQLFGGCFLERNKFHTLASKKKWGDINDFMRWVRAHAKKRRRSQVYKAGVAMDDEEDESDDDEKDYSLKELEATEHLYSRCNHYSSNLEWFVIQIKVQICEYVAFLAMHESGINFDLLAECSRRHGDGTNVASLRQLVGMELSQEALFFMLDPDYLQARVKECDRVLSDFGSPRNLVKGGSGQHIFDGNYKLLTLVHGAIRMPIQQGPALLAKV